MTKPRTAPLKISVISGACVARDAISEAVRGSLLAFQERLGAEVCLFTYANDFPGYQVKIVSGVGDVILDPFYMQSDVILYHFGIAYEMFGALLLGNGKAKQIVRYHNVTPKAFLPESAHALTDKSLRQISLADEADLILADSAFNKQDLVRMGIAAERIQVVPLYVKFDTPRRFRKAESTARPVRLLYVGRFVKSKGVTDLIEALGQIKVGNGCPFTLTMAGNVGFSDPAYIDRIHALIAELGLEEQVRFEADVSDARLGQLYDEADLFVMPSYHEGFCVPVLEALHSGCVPVTSTAGNLPGLVGDLGATFAPGDIDALAEALETLGGQFTSGRPDALRLGDRSLSWKTYEQDVGRMLDDHTFRVFAERMATVVRDLLPLPPEPQPRPGKAAATSGSAPPSRKRSSRGGARSAKA